MEWVATLWRSKKLRVNEIYHVATCNRNHISHVICNQPTTLRPITLVRHHSSPVGHQHTKSTFAHSTSPRAAKVSWSAISTQPMLSQRPPSLLKRFWLHSLRRPSTVPAAAVPLPSSTLRMASTTPPASPGRTAVRVPGPVETAMQKKVSRRTRSA